jgi:anti-anti-sigma regulatory factor
VRGVVSLEQKGGKLKLLRISPFVREVLGITRLLDVIETFDDEAVALQSFTL